MNSWEELVRTLKAERETYLSFSTILIQEQESLRRMHYRSLLEIGEQKSIVIDKLNKLGRRRAALTAELRGTDLSSALGVWLLHADSPWGKQAALAFQELVELGKQVERQMQEHAAQLHRALSVVREAINLVYQSAGMTSVYQETGYFHHPSRVSSINLQG